MIYRVHYSYATFVNKLFNETLLRAKKNEFLKNFDELKKEF